jgi:hypothetical protein
MPDYFENTPLKPSSKAFYNSRLTVLAHAAKTQNFSALFINPTVTVNIIRDYLKSSGHDTVTGFHGFVKSLLAYRKYHPAEFQGTDDMYPKWMELLGRLYGQATEYREMNEPSITQKNKSGHEMTMEEIIGYRDNLSNADPIKLLIAFYTMIPPVRADYGEVEILDFDSVPTSRNYIFVGPSRAVMNIGDHKTADSMGPIRSVLPDPLRMLLAKSIALNPRKWLFQTTRKTPYTRARFSQWANKHLSELFDREFTLTLFRHIYLSGLKMDELTVQERERIAYQMGHNRTQQDLYRWV